MKLMKKLMALALALTMVLALTACGGKEASDADYVKGKGTLVVGITDFAPMDYKEAGSEEWVGFDADMAKAFAEYLGVKVVFQEIGNWDLKAVELETKAVDVVWNGMTITEEVKSLMGVSEAYCLNQQVVVMSAAAAANYQTADSIKALTFAVENGSAGAEALDGLGITYTAVDTQGKALMEVASGSVDACVIDLLMAGAMIGEGTSYPDLTTAVALTEEEYGVGFRQGSDLIGIFNQFWKEAYDSGKVMDCAEQYGIAKNIIEK